MATRKAVMLVGQVCLLVAFSAIAENTPLSANLTSTRSPQLSTTLTDQTPTKESYRNHQTMTTTVPVWAGIENPLSDEDTGVCPEACHCKFDRTSTKMVIENCSKDPGDSLDMLLSRHPSLTELTITSSNLVELPQFVCNLTKLEVLNLSHNHLSQLPWECLKELENLKAIWLYYNNFTSLANEIFYNFPSLENISFAHNQINVIGSDVFRNTKRLPPFKMVDLQSNGLVRVDWWPLFLLDRNASVNLRNNKISTFTNHGNHKVSCRYDYPKKLRLNLSGNNVHHLRDILDGWKIQDESARKCFIEISSLISLDKNPLICDCTDYPIYRLMRLSSQLPFHDTLFCNSPPRLYRQRIISVNLDQFICSNLRDCPINCTCTNIPHQKNISIDCINAGFIRMPRTVPQLPTKEYRYHLNFMRNKFDIFDSVPYFEQASAAIFTYNPTKFLTPSVLSTLQNAKKVFFDYNHLYYLPRGIYDVVNMTNVEEIRMQGNTWICDCYANETRKWFIDMGDKLSDRAGILCDSPRNLKGKNMLMLDEDELVCRPPPGPPILLYLGVGVGTFFGWLIVFSIPTAIIYSLRMPIFLKSGWHPFDKDECNGEYKEFDIFLAYAEVDNAYAMGSLFEDLENKLGYKVAHHKVYYVGGKPIKTNIQDCVRKSKRTIVVLSPGFFRSEWCIYELNTALDFDKKYGVQRLVGIILEDLDTVEDMEPRQRKFINNKHRCLSLGCDRFWERLDYLLPKKKIGPSAEIVRPVFRRRTAPAAGTAPAGGIAPAAAAPNNTAANAPDPNAPAVLNPNVPGDQDDPRTFTDNRALLD